MKTKLSRVGRSSVSVILAVMMLLSTMLVGTVTTANAATGTVTVYFKDTVGWNDAYVYFYTGSYWNTSNGSGSQNIAGGPFKMTKVDGTDDIYSYTYTGNYSEYISFTKTSQANYGNFWDTEAVYRTDFSTDNTLYTPNTTSSGTYNSNVKYYNNGAWSKYSNVKPVADSVSLTADSTSVKVGNPVTLTATAVNPAVDNVTYTFKKTSGGSVTESSNGNTLTVTPSEAGTYKYTVTVSADGYSDVTSAEVSFTATAPVTYYLGGRVAQLPNNSVWVAPDSTETLCKFTETEIDGLYKYESKQTPAVWSETRNGLLQYFYVRTSLGSEFYYGKAGSGNDALALTSQNQKADLAKITNTDVKNLIYINSNDTSTNATFWLDTRDGKMQLYYTTATTYNVTFGTNSDTMGSVSAKDSSGNVVNTGSSVVENTSVTFTASANDGYKFDGWYSDADCTTAITGATDTTYTTTVTADTTVYAKFSAVDYNVTYTADGDGYTVSNVSAPTANIGDTVTFTVAPKTGYQIDSVTADNAEVTANGDGTYQFTMPAKNVAISVTASLVSYNINNGSDDTLTFKVGDKDVTTANMGNKVTVSGEKTGYDLTSISVKAENGETVVVDGFTFIMPASAVTVTPTFTANTYKITVNENANCTVTVDPTAAYNTTVNVTVKPNDGFNVTGITVTGTSGDVTVSGSAAAGYTFTMPASDVTITPSVEAVDVTAPNVTLNGGAGQTTASIAANLDYAVTANAEPGDNFSSVVAGAVPTVSCDDKNAVYTFAETGEGTGVYTFNAKTEGTYTITYKVTAKSNNSDKTADATATLTITVTFTETQKAYNDLASYYETVKNPTESDYSAEAYATLTAKLAEVKALVDAGLPASSDTDTAKYTTAKTELENAVADKLMNFYIKGRFRIKNASGNYVTINESSSTSVNENFKFTSQGDGLYSLNTGCTLSELSAAISGSTGYQYFFVYNQDNGIRYEPSADPDNAEGKDNALDLNETKSTSGWSGTRFSSTDTSGVVTLWVDASGDTYKFYYTVAVEPKYALAGGFGNPTWDKYDAQYLVNTPVEGKRAVFSAQLVNDGDSTKKFRLVASGDVAYSVTGGADLTKYSESSPLTLTAGVTGSGNDLYVPKGKYTLFVDQSGTVPKVWVERIVDTKNVNFSITGEGTGTVSINGTNVIDTASEAVEIGTQYKIELTPTADSYVESFKVGGETVSDNTYTGTMPNEDVAVEVVFAKKALHAIQITSDKGGTAKTDLSNAYSGQTVTVTVSTDDGYVFDGISVKENTSEDTVDCTKNEDGTYSFVMPDDAVNVYAKFREKLTYNVTVSSENQELGKVSLNGSEDTLTTTVKEGETVTIKATAIDPNTFNQWTISGKYTIQDSKTATDPEITLVVNGDVKASASFTETAPYQVAYGTNGTLMRMNKTKYDGIYVSTATVAASTNFTIYDSNAKKYASVSSDDYYWINDKNPSATIQSTWNDSYVDQAGKGLVRNAYSTAKYVVFDANSGTITLTDDPDYGTKVTLYAKQGTYYQKGCTSEYASSTEATGTGVKSTSTTPCNTYSVPFDTNINVKTTLNKNYITAGYYVAAYCVNGRNYSASAVDAENGIYQANITITEDLAQKGVVEVTPIYYNRNIEKNGDYITFYVDFDQAEEDWGSTISVDAYCYVNGNQGQADHLFGSYPGQPMVRDGRYYVINVPKYRYYIGTDGSLVKDENSPVSGVTLNNYFFDTVHANLAPIKRNMQTYDFSDFVKLANLDGVRTIMFQNQFYNADDKTAKRNMSVVYGVDTGAVPANAKKSISDIESANVNPWQDFTDYYGRYTDALGNILTDDQKNNDCLYIISTGSFNSTAYSTKGEWVTIWNVYDHNGNLVTYGTPADFLDSATDQYKALNTDAYLGKPVKISYEKGQLYSNNTSRTDGRWYYSKLGQEFTSDVGIEYKTQTMTDYVVDTNTNSENTGFVGATTKATATINNVTTASFTSVTDTAHLNVKVANGWRFDGWYIQQGDKYTRIGDNYTDVSAEVLMSNSYHIVARISEIPSGTLELNHTAYTGTDPASHSGTGFYYISAILYDQTGAIKRTFTETQGIISIDDYSATDTLEITLRAVGHGDNTIYAVYEGEAGGYSEIGEEDYRGLPNFSYTFTVPAGSLFRNDKLMVNALNYYTDIVKVGGTCDITYKYNDRFNVEGAGNMVSYVVRNVELSSEEIQKKYQPSDETITKYAPRIDTMYVDTKWILTDAGKVDKGKSQATVIATQTNKTCKVYHPELGENGYYTEIMDSTPYTVDFNSLLKDENGNFLLTTPEYNDDKSLKFAYWEVYKVNDKGEKTNEIVTKCYERSFGLRIMADYYIVPVYSENVPTLTANINSPVLNREIYGDSSNPTDKLYVDLLTAFTSTAIPTFKENTTNLTVECGVFVVRNNTSTLSADDRQTLVDAATSNATDTTSEILNKYLRDAGTEEAVVAKLKELAEDSSVKDKTNTNAKFGDDNYRITKLVFDNNTLTNKNRIDEVLKFTNNTANQNYIFTAYAFVVIKNADGSVEDMVISDSQYFNLCYVGNKALDNN